MTKPRIAESRGSAVLMETALAVRGDDLDLSDLVRAFWRRRGITLGCILLVMAIAGFVVFSMTPQYTARALIMIDSRGETIVDVQAVLSGLPVDSETARGEIEVIRSRDLIERLIDRLGLIADPSLNPMLDDTEEWPAWLDPRRLVPTAWLEVFGALGRGSAARPFDRQKDLVVEAVNENLLVAPESRSRVIKILFTSPTPETAARVANTLSDLYLESQLETKYAATERATRWLNERLTGLREQVLEAERAVERYRRESGLIEGRGVTLVAQELSEISTQLVLARTARAEAVARLRQVEPGLKDGDVSSAAPGMFDTPLIQSLREQRATAVRKAAELSQEYGERHPTMISARADTVDLRRQIDNEITKIGQSLRGEVTVARSREGTLAASVDKLKSRVADLNASDVQLRALQREADAGRALLETFLVRAKETDAQEGLQQADAWIISRASVPLDPSFPNVPLLLALSLVGAGLLGLMAAFFAERLDQGFRSGDQIEAYTGVPALGLVPTLPRIGLKSAQPETYILTNPMSALGESMRSLHTTLVLANVGTPPKILMLGSAVSNEGKSSIATALARALAMAGRKVLVIDCDLRRPSLHERFEVSARPGIADVLIRGRDVDDVIQRDPRSGAAVLTAGAPVADPPTVLASVEMQDLLDRLSERYELIIIDSPPLMAVSDALILGRLADRTVFLVRWASTRREVALAGLRQLADSGASVAGVLLSRVDVRKHAAYGFGDSGTYYGAETKYYLQGGSGR